MNLFPNYIFTLTEAARAYVKSAERIWGGDETFLCQNQAIIPIFVSMLFQSLEISIKYVGISSGLFTEKEVRGKGMRSGHGIHEMANLAATRLGGTSPDPVVMAMTHFNTLPQSREIISKMICGKEFLKTRECYASRSLGYGQIVNGDFARIGSTSTWIKSVEQTVAHLPEAADIVSRWLKSPSSSGHFAIWLESSGSTHA